MMYLPNRNLELFGEPPSLDEPSDNDLNVLDKLEKFAQIDIPSYRQQACIDIDEALNYCDTEADYDRIKNVATDLASDPDLNVRVSLLDQFQFIGIRCISSSSCRDMLFKFITNCLLHSLRDQNHQVRKSAQSSLIILTNRGFYTKGDLEKLYVHTIQEMLMPDVNTHELNDFPPEAISLISALASHLGGDIIVEMFMDRYIQLCSDMLLHVRKCCASSFPKICQVTEARVVEQKLLPVFSQLCNDDIWGVRKACAEGFTAISHTIEQGVRVQVLTPLFLHLLNDTSRYVKLAAYQQLGPFITTFHSSEREEIIEKITKQESRERSPTNPEYDNFLFWKSPVDMDPEDLEKELLGEKNPEQQKGETEPTITTPSPSDQEEQSESAEQPQTTLPSEVQPVNPATPPEKPPRPDCKPKITDAATEDVDLNSDTDSVEDMETDSGVYSQDSPSAVSCGDVSNRAQAVLPDTANFEWIPALEENKDSSATSSRLRLCSPTTTSTRPASASKSPDTTTPDTTTPDSTSPDTTTPDSTSPDTTTPDSTSPADISTSPEEQSASSTSPEEKSASSTLTSSLEERMSEGGNKSAFNAMFHGQEGEDEEEDAMQIDEQGAQLRNFFQSLLKSGHTPQSEEDKENITENQEPEKDEREKEEEVFDSNKGQEWGYNSNMFEKDRLAPKIIKLADSEGSESKDGQDKVQGVQIESDKESAGVLVGSIDITKPVFGVLEKEANTEDAYSFSKKEDDLDLASDVSDMEIDHSTVAPPAVASPVPGALIDCYTNMASNVDENNPRADDDILTHCAYAFPGVVQTLGKDSWGLLRKTYLTLAEHLPHSMSNVRQTLACSLHEIAHVIGPELTQQDLIHPFNSFIYDIDSVKIGLLKNLSKFLQHVSPRHRQELLQQMKEIQKCEDRKNWRYRQTFAQQLPHLSCLYTTKEVYEHIQPMVLNLTMDQVSQVRQASFVALSKLLNRFKTESATDYYENTCTEVKSKFASSNKCTYRQSYALICLEMIRDGYHDIIEKSFLPELLEMVNDRTPNVRLWVGQCLLLLRKSVKDPRVGENVDQLQSDSDLDVRHYSTHICAPPPS